MQYIHVLALALSCISPANSQATISYTGSIVTLSTAQPSILTGSEYTYLTNSGQSTVIGSETVSVASNSSASSSGQITLTSSSASLTQLTGSAATSSNGTMTRSSTSSAATPSNTTPCNGYPELCNRKYSNITNVVSHNSAFVKKNNAASNQEFGIIDQLNDGVRMIQGETQMRDGVIRSCHTSCELLDAGTYQSELSTIAGWVRDHPYDVVSIMIGNTNFSEGITAVDYVETIQNSGLGPYLYTPKYVPQRKDQWPTLGEMILSGKRVVMYMDYNANQTAVPYILDEYSHMWSTPFSPTDRGFPCTQQLPPNLNQTLAREDYMYLANHNLNTEVSIAGFSLLIPNTADINETNGAANDYGTLETMVTNCTAEWDRPPNWLVVDYYNRGSNGTDVSLPCSALEVAARANNVTWDGKCATGDSTSAASTMMQVSWVATLMVAFAAAAVVVL
ncbi:putative secreted protein [Acrodontium crateriforme]|uniref:Secreted protein n=1 Tax=Acrodontium crateriforme TaxID=150365 RepID=A0AAQ3M475_9PEZI|nr:putative secreted protein [Acrodontium crateriforme]